MRARCGTPIDIRQQRFPTLENYNEIVVTPEAHWIELHVDNMPTDDLLLELALKVERYVSLVPNIEWGTLWLRIERIISLNSFGRWCIRC